MPHRIKRQQPYIPPLSQPSPSKAERLPRRERHPSEKHMLGRAYSNYGSDKDGNLYLLTKEGKLGEKIGLNLEQLNAIINISNAKIKDNVELHKFQLHDIAGHFLLKKGPEGEYRVFHVIDPSTLQKDDPRILGQGMFGCAIKIMELTKGKWHAYKRALLAPAPTKPHPEVERSKLPVRSQDLQQPVEEGEKEEVSQSPEDRTILRRKELELRQRESITQESLNLEELPDSPYFQDKPDVSSGELESVELSGMIGTLYDTDLEKWLKENSSTGERIHYALQLSEAFKTQIDAGKIHRDIKPGNIFIDLKKKQVKIADWATAVHLDRLEPNPTILGTPYYLPLDDEMGLKKIAWEYESLIDEYNDKCLAAQDKEKEKLAKEYAPRFNALIEKYRDRLQQLEIYAMGNVLCQVLARRPFPRLTLKELQAQDAERQKAGLPTHLESVNAERVAAGHNPLDEQRFQQMVLGKPLIGRFRTPKTDIALAETEKELAKIAPDKPEVVRTILAMLDPDPEKRPSIEEVHLVLKNLAPSEADSKSRVSKEPQTPQSESPSPTISPHQS